MTPRSISVLPSRASVRILGGGQITLNQPRAARVVTVGMQGPAGATAVRPPLFVLAFEPIAAGQPVYIGQSDGKARLACAAAYTTSPVVGFALQNTAAEFMFPVVTNYVTAPDWTNIAGTATLVKGARYFLGLTPGRITTTPPTATGQCLVVVGIAAAADTLSTKFTDPYLL